MTTMTESTTKVSLDAVTAHAAIAQALVSISDGRDGRPTLAGVYVQVTRDSISFTGTDGVALVSISIPNHDDRSEWSAILEGKALKGALTQIKAAKGHQITLELAPNMQTVTITAGCDVRTIEAIQATFPHYEQLIPVGEMPGTHIAFNGALIGEIFSIAGKYAENGTVKIFTQTPSQPARLNWHGTEGKWDGVAVVMPMFVTW